MCVCVCLKTIFSLLFCPTTFVRTTCQGVHGRVRLGLPMGREVTHQWLARWCGADGRGLMSPFGAWSQTVRQGDSQTSLCRLMFLCLRRCWCVVSVVLKLQRKCYILGLHVFDACRAGLFVLVHFGILSILLVLCFVVSCFLTYLPVSLFLVFVSSVQRPACMSVCLRLSSRCCFCCWTVVGYGSWNIDPKNRRICFIDVFKRKRYHLVI